MEGLDYTSICQIVGRMYLEFSVALERERTQTNSLYQEIERLKTLINDPTRTRDVGP